MKLETRKEDKHEFEEKTWVQRVSELNKRSNITVMGDSSHLTKSTFKASILLISGSSGGRELKFMFTHI